MSFHKSGIFLFDMVVAEQMQHSMHDQMGHMVAHRLALLFRFAGAGFPSNGDIAKGFRVIRLARLWRLGIFANKFRRPLFRGPAEHIGGLGLVAEIFVQDSTTSWSYTSSAWRAANNSAGNRISFVCGLLEDGVRANYAGLALSTASAVQVGIGIALDATGTVASNASAFTTFFLSTANNQISGVATYSGYAGLGFHYLQAIESGGTSAAFNGVNGITHAGLSATIWH